MEFHGIWPPENLTFQFSRSGKNVGKLSCGRWNYYYTLIVSAVLFFKHVVILWKMYKIHCLLFFSKRLWNSFFPTPLPLPPNQTGLVFRIAIFHQTISSNIHRLYEPRISQGNWSKKGSKEDQKESILQSSHIACMQGSSSFLSIPDNNSHFCW